MFSIKNDDPIRILFIFSDGLENAEVEQLARRLLSKGELYVQIRENLEHIIRRCVFRDFHRKKVDKICLKAYELCKNLTKTQMKDYRVEIFEFWDDLDTSIDVTVAFVSETNEKKIKKVGNNFRSFPTYFPIFLEN